MEGVEDKPFSWIAVVLVGEIWTVVVVFLVVRPSFWWVVVVLPFPPNPPTCPSLVTQLPAVSLKAPMLALSFPFLSKKGFDTADVHCCHPEVHS